MLVVGAGFSGSVVARQLAEAGRKVAVVEKRPHIGGNAYDCYDEHGVLIHPYGPHIFHTNSDRVWNYLSRFTKWRPYVHRTLARIGDKLVPFPINLTTVKMLYGLDTDQEAAHHLRRVRLLHGQLPVTSEDHVLALVGRDLCKKFFRGYTWKQWGLDLSELSASVAGRIPVRLDTDDRYFDDKYQALPADGYTKLFENLLDHPNIEVDLDLHCRQISNIGGHVLWTGPIDEYFDYIYGTLPYRSIHFRHIYSPKQQVQAAAIINYPDIKTPWTRRTEFKQLTGQKCAGTTVCFEYPQAEGEPFYPIPTPANALLYARYKRLADTTSNVTFVGRLGQYRYYNMDQAVGAALSAADRLLGRK